MRQNCSQVQKIFNVFFITGQRAYRVISWLQGNETGSPAILLQWDLMLCLRTASGKTYANSHLRQWCNLLLEGFLSPGHEQSARTEFSPFWQLSSLGSVMSPTSHQCHAEGRGDKRVCCNHPGRMSWVSLTWEGSSKYSPPLAFQTPLGRSERIWHGWRKDMHAVNLAPLLICPEMHPHARGISLLPWTGGSSWACAGDSQCAQWFKPGKKKISKVSWYYHFLYSLESLESWYCLPVLWWTDPVNNLRYALMSTSKEGQFN